MVERTPERGFTLIEILISMGLLALAIGPVLAGFTRGSSQVIQAELLRDAARAAQIVQERLMHENVLGRETDALPEPILDQTLPGFTGLRYDVFFEGRVALGAPVYCRLSIRWRNRGQEVGEIFRFPLPRGVPLSQRIRESQENVR